MSVTVSKILEMKKKGEKITMLTAYDYTTAKLVDEAGVPCILVGDSLGMVVLGYNSTIPVTLEAMLHHTKAVVRGVKNALVIGDMPFMTYQASEEEALHNAARFLQEAGCPAVKLEGGVTMEKTIRRLVDSGIPVCGHIGLTPQSINAFGGHKIQGKTPEAAKRLLEDALAVERGGAFAVVLETVPAPLAALVTQKLTIPTIGIGAGIGCDGQVQVINDVLGSYTDFVPKHAKQYAQVAKVVAGAIAAYHADVRSGAFPTEAQSFPMDETILKDLK
ncbi:MAG TPA: 3-methyl-2-oxobutanoate hydroxymethyltransferase [Spirochaetes bacterium]|nr:3-methyl-2-oxobutanoate hydroxymethyltransferase [Spirochaetota bacterium]